MTNPQTERVLHQSEILSHKQGHQKVSRAGEMRHRESHDGLDPEESPSTQPRPGQPAPSSAGGGGGDFHILSGLPEDTARGPKSHFLVRYQIPTHWIPIIICISTKALSTGLHLWRSQEESPPSPHQDPQRFLTWAGFFSGTTW